MQRAFRTSTQDVVHAIGVEVSNADIRPARPHLPVAPVLGTIQTYRVTLFVTLFVLADALPNPPGSIRSTRRHVHPLITVEVSCHHVLPIKDREGTPIIHDETVT